jgi:hypothetical protein
MRIPFGSPDVHVPVPADRPLHHHQSRFAIRCFTEIKSTSFTVFIPIALQVLPLHTQAAARVSLKTLIERRR